MTIFDAVLDCRHPLCGRGSERQRRAPVQVISAPEPDAVAFATAREAYRDARDRRCKACRRPISLRHIALIELDHDLFEVQRYNGPNQPVWRPA